jgi:general secretion pathway protein H
MRTSTPGRLASRKRNNLLSTSGLTLIEILVAMAIVGLIIGVSATGLRSVFNVNMKSAAGKLAGTLRYLSNKAVTDHRYIRVIYDLEAQTYSVEECTEPIVVSIEDEEAQAEKEKKETPKPEEGEEAPTEGEEGEEGGNKTADSCAPSESSLLKPVKLPSGVLFKDVSVSYLKWKKERGQIYTYFFPDGYATPTLVNFKDEEDENHFSVEVEALSGKVRIASEYREHFTGSGNEGGDEGK